MTRQSFGNNNICYFTLPAYGHIYPSLEYIRKLVEEGHTVYYFSVPQYKHLIDSIGATFVNVFTYMSPAFKKEFEDIHTNMFTASSHLSQTAGYSMKISYYIVKAISGLQHQWNPTQIIHDNCCLWGKILARLWQIPATCTYSTFIYSKQDLLYLPISWILYEAKEWKALLTFISFRKRLLQEYPTIKISFFDMIQNHEKTNILFMKKSLQRNSKDLSTNFHFIPRSFHSQNKTQFISPFPKNFVYVSLGTIHSQNSDLYQVILQVLGKNNIPTVVSLGGRITQIQNKYPSIIKVFKEVNQVEVLKKCSLFITHGGMNSCLESIELNVPMIILPQTSEQVLVGKRMKTLKKGDVLLKHNPSVSSIQNFILRSIYRREKNSSNSLEKQV